MILSFHNQGTEDLFNGRDTIAALRTCPEAVWNVARRKLDLLDSVSSLAELRIPPGNHLESLKRSREGQQCMRVIHQHCLCFFWTESGTSEVEIVDYQ